MAGGAKDNMSDKRIRETGGYQGDVLGAPPRSRHPHDPRGGFSETPDDFTVIRQGLDGHKAREWTYDEMSPDEVAVAIRERRNEHTYQDDHLIGPDDPTWSGALDGPQTDW